MSSTKKEAEVKEVKQMSKFRKVTDVSLDEIQLRIATRELNESKDTIEQGLKELRKMINENRLPWKNVDDQFLIKFLRVKKYDVKRSFESMKRYARAFALIKEFFKDADMEGVKDVFRKNALVLLPYRDSTGRAIMFGRADVFTRENIKSSDSLTAYLLLAYYLTHQPASQISGIAAIFDTKCIRMKDVLMFLGYSRYTAPLLKDGPARLARIDIINSSIFARLIMLATKPFGNKIFGKLTCFGSDIEDLFQHYDRRIIPEAYGGNLSQCNNDHWFGEFESYVKKIQNDSWYEAN